MVQWQSWPNYKTQPFWVKGVQILPYVHTLAGSAFGALGLAMMATLNLRAVHKTKTYSPIEILTSCQPRLKKNIAFDNHGVSILLSECFNDIWRRQNGQVLNNFESNGEKAQYILEQ